MPRKSATWETTLLPPQGRHAVDFFAQKIRRLRPGWMSFKIHYSLIILLISAVTAEILTTSDTPQIHKQPVTITFQHYLYINKHEPNTTTTTNPTSANIPVTTSSGNVYETSDFHNYLCVTWSHIMLIDKVIMQPVNTPLTSLLSPLPILKGQYSF